MPAIVTAGQRK